ncbi:CocE/NonD family hydrolase [Mycobacterium sp. DL440]|uniref:CocE/NonD family hydrolase n=1 Tax=Mycobacterium sp. DL440 TaxID=2675523 RepID=UPI00141F45DD|nr:CocE/NonD family hydrolase [Mycobacterium sp. DL440]
MSLAEKFAAVVAISTVIVGGGAVPITHADPAAPHAADSDGYYQPYSNDFTGMEGAWTAEKDGPQPHSAVHIDWDVPITMSDGVVLKANVYRPMDNGVVVTDPLPTVLNATPYTKWMMAIGTKLMNAPGIQDGILRGIGSLESSDPALKNLMQLMQTMDGGMTQVMMADKQLIKSGYVWIDLDIRGTGFSDGKWQLTGPREQQDTVEVIDWISKQDFSDGKVAATGVSYDAITALQAASHRPPALKAVFAVEPATDLVQDVALRGGGINVGFLPFWLWLVNGLKRVPDVQSMALGTYQQEYQKWIDDRAEDPTSMSDAMYTALNARSMNEVYNSPEAMMLYDAQGPWRKATRTDLANINVPTMITGGWSDLFRNAEFRSFQDLTGLKPGEKQLIIGPGYHVTTTGGYGKRDAPPRADVLQKAWFDHWIKGIDNGVRNLGPILEHMPGAQGWQRISQLPRPGMSNQRVYLRSENSHTAVRTQHDGSLSAQPPTAPDQLTVKVGVASLCSDITNTQYLGITAILMECAQNENTHEIDGLTFTSEPVSVPTVMSGPVAVHLNTQHEGTDGFWMATVSDVDDTSGTSLPLSTGWVVSSMRQVDEARSKRGPNGDYVDPIQTLDLKSGYSPVVPGKPTTIDFGTYPLDAVLQPGHRLRVSIYSSNYPSAVPPMPMMIAAGLTPPPYDVRDVALLFDRSNTFYPEHLNIDPAAPSWVSVPTSDPIG